MRADPVSPGSRITVSTRLVHAILRAAVAARVLDPTQAGALRARLLAGAPSGPLARLGERALVTLWSTLAAVGGDHGVGLRLARHADADAFGVVGEAVRVSPTLVDAFDHATRFARLVHQGVSITLRVEQREVALAYAPTGAGHGPLPPGLAAGLLWAVGNLALIPARAFGVALAPASAALACPPPSDLALADVFGDRVRFHATKTELVYDRAAVERVVARPAGAALLGYLDALAERELATLPAIEDLPGRVAALVRERLAGGAPDLPAVAGALGLSVRTLQRRLADHGLAFAAVVDRVRAQRARELLEAGEHSMGEIAYLLGYTEQAAFSRAARRWFGAAPTRSVRPRA